MWMKHPQTEGIAETTEAAFVEAWEPLGWQRADAPEDGTSMLPPEQGTETGTVQENPGNSKSKKEE